MAHARPSRLPVFVLILVLGSLAWVRPAGADSILLGTRLSIGMVGMVELEGTTNPTTAWVAQSFHLNEAVQLTYVNIGLDGAFGYEGPAVVQLTNAIGPETTAANVLAEATVSVKKQIPQPSLFGEVAVVPVPMSLTLGPGTYFIVASTQQPDLVLGWQFALSQYSSTVGTIGDSYLANAYSAASGIPNTDFAPASTWVRYSDLYYPYNEPPAIFELVGTPTSSVPDAGSTLLLFTTSLATLGLLRRRQR